MFPHTWPDRCIAGCARTTARVPEVRANDTKTLMIHALLHQAGAAPHGAFFLQNDYLSLPQNRPRQAGSGAVVGLRLTSPHAQSGSSQFEGGRGGRRARSRARKISLASFFVVSLRDARIIFTKKERLETSLNDDDVRRLISQSDSLNKYTLSGENNVWKSRCGCSPPLLPPFPIANPLVSDLQTS